MTSASDHEPDAPQQPEMAVLAPRSGRPGVKRLCVVASAVAYVVLLGVGKAQRPPGQLCCCLQPLTACRGATRAAATALLHQACPCGGAPRACTVQHCRTSRCRRPRRAHGPRRRCCHCRCRSCWRCLQVRAPAPCLQPRTRFGHGLLTSCCCWFCCAGTQAPLSADALLAAVAAAARRSLPSEVRSSCSSSYRIAFSIQRHIARALDAVSVHRWRCS